MVLGEDGEKHTLVGEGEKHRGGADIIGGVEERVKLIDGF